MLRRLLQAHYQCEIIAHTSPRNTAMDAYYTKCVEVKEITKLLSPNNSTTHSFKISMGSLSCKIKENQPTTQPLSAPELVHCIQTKENKCIMCCNWEIWINISYFYWQLSIFRSMYTKKNTHPGNTGGVLDQTQKRQLQWYAR